MKISIVNASRTAGRPWLTNPGSLSTTWNALAGQLASHSVHGEGVG
jgi:hypothetical protein